MEHRSIQSCEGRVVKIAFAGVSSTGKTTLSTAIAKELGLPQVHEPLAEAFDWCRSILVNRQVSVEDCRYFTQQDKVNFEWGIFNAVSELESNHPSFVADSARYVHMMYMLYFCAGNQPAVDSEMMYEWFMDAAAKYDAVFYLPLGLIPIVDDNRRLTDKHLLQGMDGVLRSVIEDAERRGHKVFRVHHRELKNRIAFVKSTLTYDLKLLPMTRAGEYTDPYCACKGNPEVNCPKHGWL